MSPRDRDCRRTSPRPAVSLVEVLIACAVVAALVGLALPAVQKVRAAASRSSCANNLGQLAKACLAYESSRGRIPLGYCGSLGRGKLECFSAQARLLPYLDQSSLSEAIDWADRALDFPGQQARANERNLPLLETKVPVFLCPADWRAAGGALSYRQSVGWGLLMGGGDPLPRKLLSVTDGQSATALFGERLVADPGDPTRNPLLVAAPPEKLAGACVEAQLAPVPAAADPGDPYAGTTWLRGADRHARYGHLLPPNSRLRDCESAGWVGMSAITARSGHPGGVTLTFLDGHVRFVGNGVDFAVWRAWGTPRGGELTP